MYFDTHVQTPKDTPETNTTPAADDSSDLSSIHPSRMRNFTNPSNFNRPAYSSPAQSQQFNKASAYSASPAPSQTQDPLAYFLEQVVGEKLVPLEELLEKCKKGKIDGQSIDMSKDILKKLGLRREGGKGGRILAERIR